MVDPNQMLQSVAAGIALDKRGYHIRFLRSTCCRYSVEASRQEFLMSTHNVFLWSNEKNEPLHDKTNKMTCAPAKIQISLGICPV